jgi:peptide/nickel transport system permease protein
VILAVGFGGAPGFARLSRTVFLSLLERPYIRAARAIGAGRPWIARLHLLPNSVSTLLPLATVHLAWAFMGTTTLTFLGFSGDPALAEWGAMLNSARLHLIEEPRLALAPGMAISLTILAFHTLGGSLSRSLDPKRRRNSKMLPS